MAEPYRIIDRCRTDPSRADARRLARSDARRSRAHALPADRPLGHVRRSRRKAARVLLDRRSRRCDPPRDARASADAADDAARARVVGTRLVSCARAKSRFASRRCRRSGWRRASPARFDSGAEFVGVVWIIEGDEPLSELDHRAAEYAALVAAIHVAHQRELASLEATPRLRVGAVAARIRERSDRRRAGARASAGLRSRTSVSRRDRACSPKRCRSSAKDFCDGTASRNACASFSAPAVPRRWSRSFSIASRFSHRRTSRRHPFSQPWATKRSVWSPGGCIPARRGRARATAKRCR